MDPLFECLVAWVNTFENLNNGKNVKSAEDFKDGILIAKCLNNIDSEHFNDDWMSKIKADTNENWRLKLLNLKKILQTLTDYYTEVLNHSLSGFTMPNLNLILESAHSSEVDDELSHFLQLVLGCAVNCERKSDFIKNIMEMNEYTQHMLMTAIQELMCKDRSMARSPSSLSFNTIHDEDVNSQYKKTVLELNRVNELREDLDKKCKRLDKQVSELQDEKMSLMSEMEMLKEKIQQEDNARIDPNNEINIQLKLQSRLDTMQEEFYKLESEKEKYRIQFEAAKLEQDLLMEKNIEYKKLAQDAQILKDEVDVLKHTSSKVEKLESTIDSYKIKLEEMGDLKRQMKQMEESNTRYLEKIIELEEEVKRISTLKSQIDMYKKKIQELHEQCLNDEMRTKKLEYEYKGMEESYVQTVNNLRSEKDRIQSELERLKETHEQLIINSQTFQSSEKINENNTKTKENQDIDGPFSSVELVNIPSETKEKIIRLYHENKLLKSKQNDFNEEKLDLLQSQYEYEKQRSSDLQTKLNETSKLKIEVECQLNDLKKKDTENNNTSLNNSDQQSLQSKDIIIEELKTKLASIQEKVSMESNNSDSALKKLQAQYESLINEKNELKIEKDKEIQKKQKDLEDMQEKLKSYLEKAKIVIRSLDPSKNSAASETEIQYLKASVTEKDKLIKQLTKENEKIRNSREQEENLMVSAWYNQGISMNRRATDERISTIGNSFLSQQRHLPSVLNGSPILNNSSKKNTSAKFSPNYHYKKNSNLNDSID